MTQTQTGTQALTAFGLEDWDEVGLGAISVYRYTFQTRNRMRQYRLYRYSLMLHYPFPPCLLLSSSLTTSTPPCTFSLLSREHVYSLCMLLTNKYMFSQEQIVNNIIHITEMLMHYTCSSITFCKTLSLQLLWGTTEHFWCISAWLTFSVSFFWNRPY